MKTKILGVVAVCAFALTVGTANADTFYVNGTFSNSLVTTLFCTTCSPQVTTSPGGSTSLSGTVTIDNGTLTSFNLTAPTFLGPANFVTGIFGHTLSNLSPDGQSWDLSLIRNGGIGSFGGGSLAFRDSNGVLTGLVANNCCSLLGGPAGSLRACRTSREIPPELKPMSSIILTSPGQ